MAIDKKLAMKPKSKIKKTKEKSNGTSKNK